MGTPNINDSVWTKYREVVEVNKEKRKYSDGIKDEEPLELIYDETCEGDTDDSGKPIPYPWAYTNLLSSYWVKDLFGNDWPLIDNLLSVAEADLVFVDGEVYYREQYIRNVLSILQALAKSNIVNILRPMPQMIKSIAKPVYTSKDLMTLLNVKESTLRGYRDNGYLGFTKIADKIWYTQEQLDEFLNNPKHKHLPYQTK